MTSLSSHCVDIPSVCQNPLDKGHKALEHVEPQTAMRVCKALCYEDICLWVVRNPEPGETHSGYGGMPSSPQGSRQEAQTVRSLKA